MLAVEVVGDEKAREVVAGVGTTGGRELQQAVDHRGDFGDRLVVGVGVGCVHHRMEEVGVELPVVVRQTHQPHGENGRDGTGVVEHEIHCAIGDLLVEEPVDRLLHERSHPLDGAGGEERGECPAQAEVVGAVDLADAQWRLSLRTWHAHLTLVVDAVRSPRFVLVRERVAVPRRLGDRVVTGDEPESAVFRVPRDRTPASQVGVDLEFVVAVRTGVVIEVDDNVGTDVGAAHYAIFAFLGGRFGRARDAPLAEGVVLSVQSWVTEEGIGGCLERGTVRVESGGPTTMTRYRRL